MLQRIVQGCFWIFGGVLGAILMPGAFEFAQIEHFLMNNMISAVIIGAALFYFLTFWLVEPVVKAIKWAEEKLVKTPLSGILFGTLGLLLGLILAFLLSLPLGKLLGDHLLSQTVPFILSILFGYLGLAVGLKRRREFVDLFLSGIRRKKGTENDTEYLESKKKIIDTSVIIDGRIADICRAGFLEGTIVIPRFVLAELQYIADSADTLKRTRGRRGLDILNILQNELSIDVEIYEGDFVDVPEVDAKLVRLAKELDGVLMTNDLNLNKVSEFQQVPVLNINDLSNALKPVVIPGENMRVLVVKDGREHNQGVAYLDDGTMIVVDDGRRHIGESVQVTVTSVLQTSAGRMIFAKFKAA